MKEFLDIVNLVKEKSLYFYKLCCVFCKTSLRRYELFVVPFFTSFFFYAICFVVLNLIAFSIFFDFYNFLGYGFLVFGVVLTIFHSVTGVIHVIEDYTFDTVLRILFCGLLNALLFKSIILVIFIF